jgi:hypothetical protein
MVVEVTKYNAAQLMIQRQAEELRQETEQPFAMSMRLYDQPDRDGKAVEPLLPASQLRSCQLSVAAMPGPRI